eukprot:scaffold153547_cov38-Prasinocladus_malaysianus.AAC.1
MAEESVPSEGLACPSSISFSKPSACICNPPEPSDATAKADAMAVKAWLDDMLSMSLRAAVMSGTDCGKDSC